MSPSKKTSILHNLQRRKTQLIFTSFFLIFSLLIVQNFFITSTSITNTISTTVPTATSHLLAASNFLSSLSSFSNSSTIIAAKKITSSDQDDRVLIKKGSNLVNPVENGSDFVRVSAEKNNHSRRSSRKKDHKFVVKKRNNSCDIFDGKWVLDDSDPIYPPGSCPFLDDTFNCFNNGRSDLRYLRYRWQPHHCNIPRFDGKKMLEMLRGKRMVFVGDSLNRNMWESLVCSLRMSLVDKNSMCEVLGRKQFRTEGFYSFKFQDYNCTIEFIRSPFLVQEWKIPVVKGIAETRREMLRLDLIQATTNNYHNADFLIFNTGHWWTHTKTRKGKNFFQEGDIVHPELKVTEAYTKALKTWAKWVDKNVNKTKTQVFFAGYTASHFRKGKWNSGGTCDEEIEPITNENFLRPYPWMMKTLESVISKMKTPVVYLNITKMTDYRKDAHPSIYRQPGSKRWPGMIQDCSHWCLPGVPDSWNQLLYASMLMSSKKSERTNY